MNKTVKKIIATAMTVTMSLGILSGCFAGKDASKDIIDAAKPYMKAVLARKISQISKLSTDDFKDDKRSWSDKLDLDERFDRDEAEAYEAICDSISYTIDEDSATGNTRYGEGYIDLTVKIADYDALTDDVDIMESPDSFAREIDRTSEKREYDLRLEFELVGDAWLVSNHEEVLTTIFDFMDERFEYYPNLSGVVYGIEIYSWTEYRTDIFTNPAELDCWISYDWESDISDIYTEVYYEGTLVMTTSRGLEYFAVNTECADIPSDPIRPDGLATGQYQFIVYDGIGRILVSRTVSVVNTEYRPHEQFGWYSETVDHGSYAIYNDTCLIDLDLTNHYGDPNVYYTVTYNGELVYTSPLGTYEGYYNSDGEGDWNTSGSYMDPGIYVIMFYDDATDTCYGSATAIVLRNNHGLDGTQIGGYIGFDKIDDGFSYDIYASMGNPYWIMDDGSDDDFAYYGSNPGEITYVLPVDQDLGTMEFYVEYSDTGFSYDNEDVTDTMSVEVTEVDGELRYEFVFDGDGSSVEDGYYTVHVQFDGGDPCVIGYCRVGEAPTG